MEPVDTWDPFCSSPLAHMEPACWLGSLPYKVAGKSTLLFNAVQQNNYHPPQPEFKIKAAQTTEFNVKISV